MTKEPTQPPAPTADPKIGSTLDRRFLLEERLGSGGMGVVYRATEPATKRAVAVKFLHDSFAGAPDLVRRFQREVKAMRKLSHKHLVTILDSGVASGVPYLVMEFLGGRSLTQLMEAGPLEPARAVRIALQILEGVQHAHGSGVVHRDLKPDNIVLLDDDFVKILDFGLAKIAEESSSRLTTSGLALGTPSYMSPEQARGKPADERADVYAVGVMLYQMVVGARPFVADSAMAVMRMHMEDAPKPPRLAAPAANLSGTLDAAILRALGKEPEDRWPSAQAFIEALQKTTEGGGAGSELDEAEPFDATLLAEMKSGVTPAPTVYGKKPPPTPKSSPDAREGSVQFPTAGPPPPAAGPPEVMEPEGLPRSYGGIWITLGAIVLAGGGALAWTHHVGKRPPSKMFDEKPPVTAAANATTTTAKPAPPEPVAEKPLEKPTAPAAAAEPTPVAATEKPPEPVAEKPAEKPPEPVAEKPAEKPDKPAEAAKAADDDEGDEADEGDTLTLPPEMPGQKLEQSSKVALNKKARSADAQKLLAKGKVDQAIQVLYQLRKRTPKSAEVALLLGHAYFRKVWRHDALREYEHAISLQATLKKNPLLIRNTVAALDDPTYLPARWLIKKRIGAAALPEVKRVARVDKDQKVKKRAGRLVRDLSGGGGTRAKAAPKAVTKAATKSKGGAKHKPPARRSHR